MNQTVFEGSQEFIVTVGDSTALLLAENARKGYFIDPEFLTEYIGELQIQHKGLEESVTASIREVMGWVTPSAPLDPLIPSTEIPQIQSSVDPSTIPTQVNSDGGNSSEEVPQVLKPQSLFEI